MNLHITNTDTGTVTKMSASDLADTVRQLVKAQGLNARHDVTLFIWHGKNTPSPAVKVRDFHGKKASTVI